MVYSRTGGTMELRDLEYFRSLARTGSISESAREHFISPQGLRKGIRRLEGYLNCNIFDPSRPGWQLTREGEAVLEYAETVRYESDRLVSRIHAIKEESRRIVRIVTTPHVKELIVPRLTAFQRNNPDMRIEVEEFVDSLCEERLMDERYAFGILQAPFDGTKFLTTPILTKRFAVWVRAKDAESLPAAVRLPDLDGRDVVLLDDTHKAYGSFIDACTSAGVSPHLIEKSEIVWVVEHVRKHGGFGLTLPQYPIFDGLSMLPLEGFTWTIGLCLPHDRTLSKDAMMLMEMLGESS